MVQLSGVDLRFFWCAVGFFWWWCLNVWEFSAFLLYFVLFDLCLEGWKVCAYLGGRFLVWVRLCFIVGWSFLVGLGFLWVHGFF